MTKKKVTPRGKPGPKPEALKIDGDWKAAVGHALRKGLPHKAKPT